MSQDAIQNVRATQALRADNDTPVDDLKQGEFVLDELQSGDLEARLKGMVSSHQPMPPSDSSL